MRVETSNIFDVMREDLDLVRDRVADAARVDFPIVSGMVRDIVEAGGKQLRPIVLLLAGKAFTYDRDRLITAAAGVELLHTASLVHDDSIDRASIRRGQPTLNSRINTGAVILIGDFLFAQSAILAAATQNPRVVAIFASSLGDICDGQLREMLSAHNVRQERDEYLKRIYGKTASLFAGAAEMGAVIGGASEADIEQMKGYGADLGMAFQIIDDVLDLREQSQAIGKPAGNDLRQGVVTLPTMYYLEGLDEGSDEFEIVERVIAGEETRDAGVNGLVDAIRASGALEMAIQMADGYIASARARLDVVRNPDVRRHFEEILDIAVSRTA
ncbi:MAG TPA: polyprenyl synthetase family protein [Thermomicrobiales bacterium]|nr:polyprenyl synthetase family protein [Thermomicrobiales bacterium]